MNQEVQLLVLITLSANTELTKEAIIELAKSSDYTNGLEIMNMEVISIKEEKDVYENE
jgi:hypothetical protein